MKVKTDINPAAILRARGLGDSDRARIFLANEVARLSDPYVPMSAGAGAHMKNQRQIAEDGRTIAYPGPYAHYQYVGKVYGPNIPITKNGNVTGFYSRAPKHPTGGLLTYHGAPLRGPEWDKRMLADRKGDLTRSAANFVGGKPK